MNEPVKAWMENVIIPTYEVGAPEKQPMFLEKRVYQGSSGVVYPYAVIEKIYDDKTEKSFQAVFIENKYIKIMVLPELGGRIQMAYDKIKQRHFVYYNQVIKPALVGLTGPWISGGIEFNWPQHHRPSTFEPVDFTIEENDDGSKTVWLNEVERMFHTKGLAGITLYPGKAYMEIKGKLYNRTSLPQTFLWWANPAVKVNDDYQSIFPPDVFAVYDHGKRDVSSFPIAKGVYYKVDYSPGTDISRYKNIPVPTSYMAVNSKYNFMGGYEHDSKGGLLHVADHHISPGKKQWTWGYGEFGQAWNKNLTDEDGPYIELMTGVYTDNQPDFSWLQPYEEKIFEQYFMPYAEVGVIKNATKEAAIGIEFDDKEAEIKLYVTGEYLELNITLHLQEKEIFSEIIHCTPEAPYTKRITFEKPLVAHDIVFAVTDIKTSKLLVSYQVEKVEEFEIPPPACAAKRPFEVENNEQLYLTGLHIEQYRHATYIAKDYYEEALRRDEKDARNNNALGLWYLRRGKFAKAELFFNKAIQTLTERNSNPYNGEVLYNLGLALKMQEKTDAAYDAFYKAVWNDAWQHAGYLQLAQIACMRESYIEALNLVDKSLIKNFHSHTARHAKVFILRKLGRFEDALTISKLSLKIDPFNFGCHFENYLLFTNMADSEQASESLKLLNKLSRKWVHNFIEYAFDYAHAGLLEEASGFLKLQLVGNVEPYPMLLYYLGYFSSQQQQNESALEYFIHAAKVNSDYCFPNRMEDIMVLQTATELNSKDAKAFYYLGNLWYDKRQYDDAIECWERSVNIDDSFSTAFRNLSLAYYNKLQQKGKALQYMEKAFSLDNSDSRILMELDQLYKITGKVFTERLSLLQSFSTLVEQRDDLYLERITLYNNLNQFHKAKELIEARIFHPWEGGEGKVVAQYLFCHLELARQAINNHQYQEALELLNVTMHYPVNLGEGKLYGAPENERNYLLGCVYEGIGVTDKALESFKAATAGNNEPAQAIYYNDPQPDKIMFQGLAWIRLREYSKAKKIFEKLICFGEKHMNEKVSIDYFAVSLPDML
ncbi:MAG: DUF5107 domain-containing protein, partial [Ginsengibacter sp.]